MTKKIKELGGVRIRNFNATWPFASLQLEPEYILIKVLFFKKIKIMRHEIEDIQEYIVFPLIGQGIIITLKSEREFGSFISKTSKIIFWYFGGKRELKHRAKDILKLK